MAGGNSPLISYRHISPNAGNYRGGAFLGRKRTHKIDTITPHCVVGLCSVETLGNIFGNKNRQASCNYGIGADGRIGLYCDELDRSWCSSNADNDNRAITIECASATAHPYEMPEVVYKKLEELIVDICKRNGIKKLLWLGSKEKTLSYAPKDGEAVLTAHRWFANKSCPGDWLYSRYGELAKNVTKKLDVKPVNKPAPQGYIYRVQVGAFKNRNNADAQLARVKKAGFDAWIIKSGVYFKIQVGAFKNRFNAEVLQTKLRSSGFNSAIIRKRIGG